jgi:AbiV family abortive infection protein
MTAKILKEYNGKLNCKQIADGMNAANRNALRLVEDAEILLNVERYATAASLAVLSIEESYKKTILRSMALAINDDELQHYWRDYRTHTKKNILWLMPQLVAEGARQLDEFRSLFETDSKHPYILEKLKQIGFYTDCFGIAHWSEPFNVIDKDLATILVKIGRVFISKRDITEKEIELWIKHLGKAIKADLTTQKKALIHWFGEMTELGLMPQEENIMGFIQFLGLQIED